MLKKYIIPVLLVACSFTLISWGVNGHRAIGRIAENHLTPYSYYPKHADIVKKRIARAGLRLAGILNEIYK